MNFWITQIELEKIYLDINFDAVKIAISNSLSGLPGLRSVVFPTYSTFWSSVDESSEELWSLGGLGKKRNRRLRDNWPEANLWMCDKYQIRYYSEYSEFKILWAKHFLTHGSSNPRDQRPKSSQTFFYLNVEQGECDRTNKDFHREPNTYHTSPGQQKIRSVEIQFFEKTSFFIHISSRLNPRDKNTQNRFSENTFLSENPILFKNIRFFKMKLWLAFLVNEFQANPSRQQSVKTSQDRFEKRIKYFMPHISLESLKLRPNIWAIIWLRPIRYDSYHMSHRVDFETLKKLKPGTFTADGKPHMVQQHPITCLDGLTNVEYQPGDEWTQTRIFDNGPTTGMEGQFRFVIFSKSPMHRKIMRFDSSKIWIPRLKISWIPPKCRSLDQLLKTR